MSKTSTEVKQRWIDKAYQRYTISLRHDRDQDIIDYITQQPGNPSEVVRAALLEKIEREKTMKHICNARFGSYKFGIAIADSIDNKGMFRLIDENTGDEIEDMFESEAEAIEAICAKYPDNDM